VKKAMKKYKNSTKLFKIGLFLFGIGIIFSLGINTSAAANPSNIYVNGSSGNDNWNGLNSTYSSGSNGPKATITNATGTVTSKGTVHIASGIYNESNIQINTNMTIIGENQKNTIINGQKSGNSIFTIASGVNVTIINLTLTNGTSVQGGAIFNSGILTVDNSTFTNNSASNSGGAIFNEGILTVDNSTFTNNSASNSGGGAINNNGGTLTVENSTFTNNSATTGFGGSNLGGAIENSGTLTIENSTFANNSATSGFGGANYGGAIFNNGILTVDNSTFTNNSAPIAGAIYNNRSSTSTIDNSTFTNNSATSSGGAIENNNYATLTVDNSTFTNNSASYGGAIHNSGTLTVDNTTFTNNTAQSGNGGAINNNGGTLTVTDCTFNGNKVYGYLVGGGAIYNQDGTLTVDNSTFTNNYATFWGGAINNAGTLIVNNSTFTNNTVFYGYGGAIYNSGTATVNFNRIIGNTANQGSAIYNTGSTMDARYNWWGSNTSPAGEISGDVTYNPWIVLTVTANPTTINVGDKSKITADLLHDSNGVYHDPVNGNVPDGLTVNFSSDTKGTVNPISTITTNDRANTTFNGISLGVSAISTTLDTQTVTTNITINKILSAYLYLQITTSNKNPKVGEPFTLTYKLGNKGPDNATNAIVTIPLPSGFNVSDITGNGNWTYNSADNTLIWTLTNVTIGDPYLYITGKINTSGIYVFGSNITSETNNLNTEGVTPIIITATNPTNPTNPTNSTILNAATTTIPMQHTGVPIAGLLFGILSVLVGSIMSRKR
jgi:autotransporter family porin